MTGILSAFTSPSSTLKKSLQLAFVYTFFNTLGVILWLPIPALRFPKLYAGKLGSIVFEYRWFLYVYVITVYFAGPLLLLGIALIPSWIGLAVVGIPIILMCIVLVAFLILKRYFSKYLPSVLLNLDWLPLWMRSLKPYDDKISKLKVLKFYINYRNLIQI